MAAELTGKVRKALEEPQFWHLATLNPDGSPQVTCVWVGVDGDELVAAHLPEHQAAFDCIDHCRRSINRGRRRL